MRTWFSNIEQHASEGVNRILIGNKCDMTDKKVSVVFGGQLYRHPIRQRGIHLLNNFFLPGGTGHPYRERTGFGSRAWNQL